MAVTRSGKASGDAKIAPKVSTSVEQLMKAAQKMSKNLNADVVVVQTKKKPFSFKNPLPSTAGINKSLKKAKTSLTKLTNAAVDWTNQKVDLTKLRTSIKNVKLEKSVKKAASLVALSLIYAIVLSSIFLLTYSSISAIQRRSNPDLELQELHQYLTDSATRVPKIPEVAAALTSLVLTRQVMKAVKL